MANNVHRLPSGDTTESGDGGNGLSERVTRLETHFEYIRRDLDEIKTDLKDISKRVNDLPTKAYIMSWTGIWLAAALAMIMIFVGVLTFLQGVPKPSPTLPQKSQIVVSITLDA